MVYAVTSAAAVTKDQYNPSCGRYALAKEQIPHRILRARPLPMTTKYLDDFLNETGVPNLADKRIQRAFQTGMFRPY